MHRPTGENFLSLLAQALFFPSLFCATVQNTLVGKKSIRVPTIESVYLHFCLIFERYADNQKRVGVVTLPDLNIKVCWQFRVNSHRHHVC